MNESWVSGPPEPTRAERESAQEWLEHDARKRLGPALDEISGINAALMEIDDMLASEDCPVAIGQLEAERKQATESLAVLEAEVTSINNLLEGR